VYVSRASDAIVAVLQVIAPSDAAGKLWEAIQSFKTVDKAFGSKTLRTQSTWKLYQKPTKTQQLRIQDGNNGGSS
jgi:hypothetical protein